MFVLSGVKKVKKKRKLGRNWSNFGFRSSGWVQKDAGGRRGWFSRLPGLKNLEKNPKIQNFRFLFPRFSRGFSPKRAEYPYKRLVPIYRIPQGGPPLGKTMID